MAENKYLDSTGVKYLWDKAKTVYQKQEAGKGLSTNDYTTAEKDKLAGLENYDLPTASSDTLGGIKIGNGLRVDENGVVDTVYNPAMDVEWDSIIDTPSTLEGFGITDAATKDELEEVREEVSKVYHFKGSVNTFTDLEDVEDPHEGDVYNVKDTGKNYAWTIEDDVGFWDDLGGVFEIESISNYELDIITGSAPSEAALRELISEGGDVSLGAILALTEALEITKDTELDLDGFTLSGNMNGYLLTANGAKLTIKGGSVNAGKHL